MDDEIKKGAIRQSYDGADEELGEKIRAQIEEPLEIVTVKKAVEGLKKKGIVAEAKVIITLGPPDGGRTTFLFDRGTQNGR